MNTHMERVLSHRLGSLNSDLSRFVLKTVEVDLRRQRWPVSREYEMNLARRLTEAGRQLRAHAESRPHAEWMRNDLLGLIDGPVEDLSEVREDVADHSLTRLNGVTPGRTKIEAENVVELLPFIPIMESLLETHLILLAMLEDPEPIDVEILHVRLPGLEQEVAEVILDRLQHTGWVEVFADDLHLDETPRGADETPAIGPRYYRLSARGRASAIDLLEWRKQMLFGTVARLLNFDLDAIFPPSGASGSGAKDRIAEE